MVSAKTILGPSEKQQLNIVQGAAGVTRLIITNLGPGNITFDPNPDPNQRPLRPSQTIAIATEDKGFFAQSDEKGSLLEIQYFV